jgi:hypothetical protein
MAFFSYVVDGWRVDDQTQASVFCLQTPTVGDLAGLEAALARVRVAEEPNDADIEMICNVGETSAVTSAVCGWRQSGPTTWEACTEPCQVGAAPFPAKDQEREQREWIARAAAGLQVDPLAAVREALAQYLVQKHAGEFAPAAWCPVIKLPAGVPKIAVFGADVTGIPVESEPDAAFPYARLGFEADHVSTIASVHPLEVLPLPVLAASYEAARDGRYWHLIVRAFLAARGDGGSDDGTVHVLAFGSAGSALCGAIADAWKLVGRDRITWEELREHWREQDQQSRDKLYRAAADHLAGSSSEWFLPTSPQRSPEHRETFVNLVEAARVKTEHLLVRTGRLGTLMNALLPVSPSEAVEALDGLATRALDGDTEAHEALRSAYSVVVGEVTTEGGFSFDDAYRPWLESVLIPAVPEYVEEVDTLDFIIDIRDTRLTATSAAVFVALRKVVDGPGGPTWGEWRFPHAWPANALAPRPAGIRYLKKDHGSRLVRLHHHRPLGMTSVPPMAHLAGLATSPAAVDTAPLNLGAWRTPVLRYDTKYEVRALGVPLRLLKIWGREAADRIAGGFLDDPWPEGRSEVAYVRRTPVSSPSVRRESDACVSLDGPAGESGADVAVAHYDSLWRDLWEGLQSADKSLLESFGEVPGETAVKGKTREKEVVLVVKDPCQTRVRVEFARPITTIAVAESQNTYQRDLGTFERMIRAWAAGGALRDDLVQAVDGLIEEWRLWNDGVLRRTATAVARLPNDEGMMPDSCGVTWDRASDPSADGVLLFERQRFAADVPPKLARKAYSRVLEFREFRASDALFMSSFELAEMFSLSATNSMTQAEPGPGATIRMTPRQLPSPPGRPPRAPSAWRFLLTVSKVRVYARTWKFLGHPVHAAEPSGALDVPALHAQVAAAPRRLVGELRAVDFVSVSWSADGFSLGWKSCEALDALRRSQVPVAYELECELRDGLGDVACGSMVCEAVEATYATVREVPMPRAIAPVLFGGGAVLFCEEEAYELGVHESVEFSVEESGRDPAGRPCAALPTDTLPLRPFGYGFDGNSFVSVGYFLDPKQPAPGAFLRGSLRRRYGKETSKKSEPIAIRLGDDFEHADPVEWSKDDSGQPGWLGRLALWAKVERRALGDLVREEFNGFEAKASPGSAGRWFFLEFDHGAGSTPVTSSQVRGELLKMIGGTNGLATLVKRATAVEDASPLDWRVRIAGVGPYAEQ